MNKFNVGDKVYCPVAGSGVFELQCNGGQTYPICVDAGWVTLGFTAKGFESHSYKTPSLFHATKANHELLSKLHPDVVFEAPEKSYHEKIVDAVADGKVVLCWARNREDKDWELRLVCKVHPRTERVYGDTEGFSWWFVKQADKTDVALLGDL